MNSKTGADLKVGDIGKGIIVSYEADGNLNIAHRGTLVDFSTSTETHQFFAGGGVPLRTSSSKTSIELRLQGATVTIYPTTEIEVLP